MSEEILIVDDNADIRNIINELIIDTGYKTRLAANYNQALAEIDKKLPDVAILDVKLDKGDNDGIELLSHIKSKNMDIPVIIISGHANIEMAVKSLQHGAFEFIEKPFDQERLLNFVKRAVENFNLKKQNKEYESKLFSSYDLIGNSKNIVNIIDGYERNTAIPQAGFSAGPCLLKDTMQLASFSKTKFDLGYSAMKVNQNLPIFLVKDLEKKINLKNKTIGIMGLSFKADIDDIRDSLSIELINYLKKRKFNFVYNDPYYIDQNNTKIKELIEKSSVIIVATPHKIYKKIKIPKKKKVIDIWNIIKR